MNRMGAEGIIDAPEEVPLKSVVTLRFGNGFRKTDRTVWNEYEN